MHCRVEVSCHLEETPRVQQVRGIFDLPAHPEGESLSWDVNLPLEKRPWSIGLIVGPSGCGKSTIARRLWPAAMAARQEWPQSAAIVDAFPDTLGVKDVVALLSAVGLSSPPAWLRPYSVLSTGQQFRVTLARMIANAKCLRQQTRSPFPGGSPPGPLFVCDEFTSTVDRTVAQIGSAAVAKAVRQHELQFVAVTCHEDVEPWLQPDWVYQPHLGHFQWRLLRRRPPISLEVVRCHASAWPLFAPHHYLSENLNASAVCFLASWNGKPVAFSAWLPLVALGPPARREHRTVCLPDFQGVGIGNAVSALLAGLWRGLGYRATSATTHPGMIRHRMKSPLWNLLRAPSFTGPSHNKTSIHHATTRLTAGFEYVGPPMDPLLARKLYAA